MKKYLLSLLLILTGCAAQTQEVVDWEILDAGDFTILAPSGWEFTPEMGIDSKVGRFSGDGMTLVWDYGMYSGDFSNNSVYFEDPSAYTVTQETVDGLDAKIYIPNRSGEGKPTVLFIENPKGAEPCTEDVCILDQENFEMLGDNLSEEEVILAIQIFKTVDFNIVDFDEETQVSCSITIEGAEDLANEALEEANSSDWGQAESVQYNELRQVYEVYYPTSEEEASLLGERGIDVNCLTGEVIFQPRE